MKWKATNVEELVEKAIEGFVVIDSQEQHEYQAQEVQNYIETYHAIAEWIRFADAKAAVVLTVNGALAGLLVPTIRNYWAGVAGPIHVLSWPVLVAALFLAWISLLALSGFWAFRCILPFRRGGVHPAIHKASHFHPAAIAVHYKLSEEEMDRFSADCEKLGAPGLKNEILASVLIDAHISNRKYSCVSLSIRIFAISVVFAALYFISIQF